MNWKKIWFGLITIGLPLVMLGATIRWYNDAGIPQKTVMAGTEIVSLQQTGPNAYRWATLNDILRSFGVTNYPSVVTQYLAYGSNYYEGDTYVSNYFSTNVLNNFVTSNYFFDFIYYTNITQTNVTLNTYLSSNVWVSNYVTEVINTNTYVSNYFQTNIFPTETVYVTNTIGGEFIANLNGLGTNTSFYGTTRFPAQEPWRLLHLDAGGYLETVPNGAGVLTNDGIGGLQWVSLAAAITVISNTTINTKFLTVESNIFYLNANPQDVAWVGPTNQIDFTRGSLQNYATWVPISITNTTGTTNGYGNTVLLCITNASGSNISYTITASGWHKGRGDPTSVTNGGIIELWFQEATGRKTLAVKEFIP